MTQRTEDYRAIGHDGAMCAMIARHDPFNSHEVFSIQQVADQIAVADIIDTLRLDSIQRVGR